MSRMIPGRSDHSEETVLRNTDAGKLIFSACRGRKMMFLIRDNQAFRICPLPETEADGIGAIFLGKVKKIVKNLSMCFVEIQKGKMVFLSLEKSEVDSAFLTNRTPDGRILEGDELLVQIQREAQKTKLASATTQLSIAGRYAAFHTGSNKVKFSSKLDGSDKKDILKILREHGFLDPAGRLIQSVPFEEGRETSGNHREFSEDCQVFSDDCREASDSPEDASGNGEKASVGSETGRQGAIPCFGVVLRTEASQAEESELLQEFTELLEQFVQLYKTARYRTCFTRIHRAPSVYQEAISQVTEGYGEIVTDDERIYEEIKEYCQERGIPLRLYADDSYYLNQVYSLNTKLEEALSRRVWLKSGAYLIIDFTEALIAIDVNSGKYSARKATEEAILQINLEAAAEIARQLRLRNLSGMILVDFINMESAKCQGQLLREMRALVKDDKVQTRVVDITPLGLMEITRKKVNATLEEQIRKWRNP